MKTEDGRELYYSLDVIQTIKRSEARYVYEETGLTLDTLYNENDYRLYSEVAREILPEELVLFLSMLLLELPALEESSSDTRDRLERFIAYLEAILEEEEDGEL